MNYFTLRQNLESIYDLVQGYALDFDSVIDLIESTIPWEEVQVLGFQTIGILDHEFRVAGAYSPGLDQQGSPCVEIELVLAKRDSYAFAEDSVFNRKFWNNIADDIATTLAHEFIHLQQHRKRNFKMMRPYSRAETPEQAYLGKRDEIEAYAFNMATGRIDAELQGRDYDVNNSGVYNYYTESFDRNHPVVLKLLKISDKYSRRLRRQYNDTIVTHAGN
jgi:hypothetical protein